MNKLVQNKKYITTKEFTVGFPYTPLYSNYYANSPRIIPVGTTIKDVRKEIKTTIYDGMPIQEETFKMLIVGLSRDDNYGRETSAWVDVYIDTDYVKEC